MINKNRISIQNMGAYAVLTESVSAHVFCHAVLYGGKESEMQSVQLAASEIWVTLIFGVIMYLFRNELKQKKVTKLLMIVCITRLLSDAVSWAFDGMPGLL